MNVRALSAANWLQHSFVLLLIAAIYGIYVNQITVGFTAFPGGLTDARFNNSVLEHLYLWSDGRAADLWRPDFFYPYPDVLTFSDNHFGSGGIYVALRHLGLDREAAYTIWHLLGPITSFAATYFVLQKFGFSPLSAAMGAIVFSFAGTMLFRTEHSQLLYRFATPLAWLYAWRFLESARLKHLGLLALFVSWQFLCAVYLGVFLVMFFMGAVLGLLVFRSTRQKLISLVPRMLRQTPALSDWLLLAFGLLLSIVTLYVLARYAWVAHVYGFERHPSVILAQQPLPGSYLVLDYSPYYHWMGQWVDDSFLRHEKQMFIGAGALLLMLAALLPSDRDTAWRLPASVLLVALIFLVVITLRFPGGFTLYWPFAHAPGFSSIRAVGRVIEVMLLPVAFISAMGFTKIFNLLNGRLPALGWVAAILFGGGFFMEVKTLHYHTTSLDHLDARQAAIRDLVPQPLPDDAVLVYRERKDPQAFVMSDVDAIVLGQQVGRPILNGYSGNFPPGYRALRTCEDILAPIAGAAYFTEMSSEDVNALIDRLVLIDFPDCKKVETAENGFIFTDPSETVTTLPIPVDLPARLALQIESLDMQESAIALTATILNSGDATLPGNFGASGNNLRFSWRFVPVGEDMPRGLNWDTRAQLMQSAQPGKMIRQTFPIVPPSLPGQYRVQLSMVQEQVMWLHDHGLQIAEAEALIAVDQDGAVQLLPDSAARVPIAAE